MPVHNDEREASTSQASGVDDTGSGAEGIDRYIRPNKRKRREHLNCAECRRLKIKCDRKIPCSNCVKRECGGICPHSTRQTISEPTDTSSGLPLIIPDTSMFDRAVNPRPLPLIEAPTADPLLLTATDTLHMSRPIGGSADSWMGNVPVLSSPQASTVTGHDAISHGTLLITQSGRSKYLGPTAASEWLRAQQAVDASRPPSPSTSRRPSPTRHVPQQDEFPFVPSSLPSTGHPLSILPDQEDIRSLVELYHRHFGWSYDLVPRPTAEHLITTFDRQTAREPIRQADKYDWLQKLALLFALLAIGTAHNLETDPDDPMGDDYMRQARTCLAMGRFMTHNSLAGVQALCLLAHYLLETDQGKDGEAAWPLWGLAMRIAQAMGLHRDGANWTLPEQVVEERRRVFWECHSAEIFQANCFSRPPCIASEFVDTRVPQDTGLYHRQKFELCRLSNLVLYAALSVNGAAYLTACELYLEILEISTPLELRCRASMQSLPSLYPSIALAVENSLPLERRQFRQTFEQHQLALLTCETIVNLFRPFFLRAIAENPRYPALTTHGRAFLSVLERSFAIIQIVDSLYATYPKVTARHWWCWCHAFNCAVCIGTFLLVSPRNDLASMVLQQFDQVTTLYSSVMQHRRTTRLTQNLKWLIRLRQRISERMSIADTVQESPQAAECDLEAGLMGWRTRLISMTQRANLEAPKPMTEAEMNMLLNEIDLGFTSNEPPERTELDATVMQDYWTPALLANQGGPATEQPLDLASAIANSRSSADRQNWLDWLEVDPA